jgi:hypothetical protein
VDPRAVLDAVEYRKSLAPAGNPNLTVQSVASRYTDCTIPALKSSHLEQC